MNKLIITVVFNKTKLTTVIRTNTFQDYYDLTQEETFRKLLLLLYDDQERFTNMIDRNEIIKALNQYSLDPLSNTLSIDAHLEILDVNDSNSELELSSIIDSARKSADSTAIQDLLTDFFEERPHLNLEDAKLLLNRFLENW